MPIRWYGPANPEDPTYRHFERIMNLFTILDKESFCTNRSHIKFWNQPIRAGNLFIDSDMGLATDGRFRRFIHQHGDVFVY